MTEPPTSSRIALIVIIVLSLAVAGGVAALGVHLARNHFERYPAAAEAGFLTQCEQSGSAQFCGCVLHTIEKKYTYKEFKVFADEFTKSGALPRGALDALRVCSG